MPEVAVFRSILDVPKEHWNSLGGSGYCGWNWLKTVEESQIADVDPCHMALMRGGKIVALAPCYVQRGELLYTVGERFVSGKVKRLLQKIGISLEPGLYCYAPLTPQSRLLACEAPTEAVLIHELVAAMERVCAAERIGFFGFPYLNGKDADAFAFLKEQGFFTMNFLPNAVLDISWKSFDAYLEDMRARSINLYKTIRREMNRNRKSGIRLQVEGNLAGHGEAFSRMTADLFRKYGKSPRRLPPHFFSRLQENMGDDVTVVTANAGDRPVGFALFVRDGGTWNFFVSGFDYAESEGTMTYFNLVFYLPIRLAIQEGIRRINYGIAAYAPKLRRGCRLEPVTMVVKCRSIGKKALFLPAARLARKRYAFHG